MYDAILVPTDGSEGTARAVEHAIELAVRYDAALHAVSVIEADDVEADVPEGDVPEESRDVAEQVVRMADVPILSVPMERD